MLISAGADIDTEDENGDTPFVHAFRGHFKDTMEILKEAGCTTEICKMSLALATRDVEFVRFCHQLDIPVENEDWNSADDTEVNILLQELRIDPFVGQYGSHGYEDSPFMYLAQEGKPHLLQLLLDKHPCLNKYTEDDKREKMNAALHRAVKLARLDNVKYFLEELDADLEAKDRHGRTPFMAACEHDQAIAAYLMEKGADIKQADSEGLSPLHWAACVGFGKLCRSLVKHEASVHAKAKLGATPLMVASSGGHLDIAQFLIANEANVNMSTPEGWTALHVAVWACAPSVVNLLITSNALPDVQSTRLTHNSDVVPGSTPLLICIFLNSMKIFRQLLDANCNINLAGIICKKKTEDGLQTDLLTPIQFTISSRSWDFAELLIRAGCRIDSVKSWLLEDGHCPVKIPEDRKKTLKKMVEKVIRNPATLKDLTRRLMRKQLGYCLVPKVEKLDVALNIKQSLLLQDLFQPPAGEGSFEV